MWKACLLYCRDIVVCNGGSLKARRCVPSLHNTLAGSAVEFLPSSPVITTVILTENSLFI